MGRPDLDGNAMGVRGGSGPGHTSNGGANGDRKQWGIVVFGLRLKHMDVQRPNARSLNAVVCTPLLAVPRTLEPKEMTPPGGIRFLTQATPGAEGLGTANPPIDNCTSNPNCLRCAGLAWGSRRRHPPTMIASLHSHICLIEDSKSSFWPLAGPGPAQSYFPRFRRPEENHEAPRIISL